MRVLITIALYPICWYLAFGLFIEYDKYQFIWSDNSWIEAAQRMLWLFWPITGIILVLTPMVIMIIRHPTEEGEYIKNMERLISELDKDLKP